MKAVAQHLTLSTVKTLFRSDRFFYISGDDYATGAWLPAFDHSSHNWQDDKNL